MAAYPLEKRELIAEAAGLRMQILTLAAGQEVPWHWHSEVVDTFWCMDGPMVI
ncbi:MAG: cupin domain-containing protein, partial [Acetobacteraceae bacterium]